MDKQWFPAAGILLADFDQFPSVPGTSAQQSSSNLLDIQTETVGHINSVEREPEALERKAEALSTEAAEGQKSPSMPGPLRSTRPLGRVIPGPIPSALTTSAAHMPVDSQPVSSGADPVQENLASGTLETIAMSSPQPSSTCGSEQKFSKVSRALWLLWNTSSPTAWRDGHSRPEASPSVALAPTISLGPPIFPRMKATEPLLPASSGRSGLDPTSQAFTDMSSSTPGPSHVTHSVTFRINSKCLTTAVWNLECGLLNRLIHYQLQFIYREAFSSFKNVSALLFRPGSTEVKASLVFGHPDPSALQVLWTLYRKVKASRWLLGHLPLADSSLSADGSNMTDLTRETISISFTLMRPFLPQLLLPGSQPFILLEKQILQLVTQEVSGFYKANPQDQPLLLFSNVNDWVSVYMEYKFRSPIPTHLKGLASYLAHHITDPTFQKSSIVANGEKAELALYETWLLILGHPFTKALENKTSSGSQALRGLLTKWLTSVLQPLQNFGQVVVEEFQQEPLTAKVQAAFFGAVPAQAIIQDCMHQALGFLQETRGLQIEMLIPVLGIPSSGASVGPSHGFVLTLQLITSLLVLVALGAAPHFTEKQIPYLS